MKSSITEFVKEVTNKIIGVLEGADEFADKEQKILTELKSCSKDIIKSYIEHIDQTILSDLKSRKGSEHVVERRGDERRLNTLLGEISYERTYYKKASGGYKYLTDRAMGFSKNAKISTGVGDALVNTAIDFCQSAKIKYQVENMQGNYFSLSTSCSFYRITVIPNFRLICIANRLLFIFALTVPAFAVL